MQFCEEVSAITSFGHSDSTVASPGVDAQDNAKNFVESQCKKN